MTELLVIFMCLKDYGCKEASTHYYKTNYNLQQKVKYSKTKVEKYIGREVSVTTGVLILGAADQKIKARITRNFFITYESGDIKGDFKWEF